MNIEPITDLDGWYGDLVDRGARHHPEVPQDVVAEQAERVLLGYWLLGEDPGLAETAEAALDSNLTKLAKATVSGAALSLQRA